MCVMMMMMMMMLMMMVVVVVVVRMVASLLLPSHLSSLAPSQQVEKIIRSRIYECLYWKESCFALTGTTPPSTTIHLALLSSTT